MKPKHYHPPVTGRVILGRKNAFSPWVNNFISSVFYCTWFNYIEYINFYLFCFLKVTELALKLCSCVEVVLLLVAQHPNNLFKTYLVYENNLMANLQHS